MVQAKESARRKLAELITEHQDLLGTSMLDETREALARSWVERLLRAFGWDSTNPNEVSREYTIKGREAKRLAQQGIDHRRPDYALVVDGERVLYIDVKRFSVDIESSEDTAFQVRSYGWSAGFRLSYACDFQELAIWDCSIPPRQDDDSNLARVRYFRFTDYLANFDTLWEYLGREASDSGWRQFNRQFADLVPFPLRRLREQANAERLASLGARIQGLQEELVTTKGEGQREAVRGGLTGLWEDLDAEVDRLYELTKAEQEVIARYPRLVSRVELPLRAAGVSEDDENTGDDS